jgi:hypothetical protein
MTGRQKAGRATASPRVDQNLCFRPITPQFKTRRARKPYGYLCIAAYAARSTHQRQSTTRNTSIFSISLVPDLGEHSLSRRRKKKKDCGTKPVLESTPLALTLLAQRKRKKLRPLLQTQVRGSSAVWGKGMDRYIVPPPPAGRRAGKTIGFAAESGVLVSRSSRLALRLYSLVALFVKFAE